MMKKSLKNTLLLNLGAFLLVLFLELLSNSIIKDKLGSDFSFFSHSLNYTLHIMGIIWVNHFILIPFFFDKKRYLLFTLLLIGTIFIAISTKGNFRYDWTTISKLFFFFLYTTGTGMAAYFIRRSIIVERKNNEKEKLQKELELNYLKEQVNPHFLFNSLNSIYALSRQQSKETPEVVMQLSELMRYQLESAKKDDVSLQEELDFIKNYLLLEEKRLGERCTIEFLIEGEVSNHKIAPMLLIPFVENAIKHGAQATNERSTVEVNATIKDDTLYVHFLNSKPGKITKSNRRGMGLENVQRRLDILYPKAHSLEIKDLQGEYQVKLTIITTDRLE